MHGGGAESGGGGWGMGKGDGRREEGGGRRGRGVEKDQGANVTRGGRTRREPLFVRHQSRRGSESRVRMGLGGGTRAEGRAG